MTASWPSVSTTSSPTEPRATPRRASTDGSVSTWHCAPAVSGPPCPCPAPSQAPLLILPLDPLCCLLPAASPMRSVWVQQQRRWRACSSIVDTDPLCTLTTLSGWSGSKDAVPCRHQPAVSVRQSFGERVRESRESQAEHTCSTAGDEQSNRAADRATGRDRAARSIVPPSHGRARCKGAVDLCGLLQRGGQQLEVGGGLVDEVHRALARGVRDGAWIVYRAQSERTISCTDGGGEA